MPTVEDFAYTGTVQSTVVPAGVETATLEVWGAQGRDYSGTAIGGPGGYVSITISDLVPGETLTVVVGGQPTTNYGIGYNGGGIGSGDGRSGGGGTDIRRGGTGLYDRIVVGGGGGGAGRPLFTTGFGGAGGYPNGQDANSGALAGGGEQTGPGAAGTGSYTGILGEFGIGATPYTTGTRTVGAGGGGWWGGSTFNGISNYRDGGGGGSSYYDTTDPAVTLNTAETVGTWTGNGKARITFADPQALGEVTVAAIEITADGAVSRSRRKRPRREYLWISGVDGTQEGVIA